MLSFKKGGSTHFLARCMSSKFVILDARQSGIVPRRRRQQNSVKSRNSRIVLAEAHQLDRQLQADQLIAKNQSEGSTLLGLVVDQLRRQKPSVKQISPKQYKELAGQLKRGYTKDQLIHFLQAENMAVSRSSRKPQLIQKILDEVWKVDKSLEDAPAGSSLVEKTIPLSDRSLFLLLSESGSLIRTWTKSGARVWLSPVQRELLVRASRETYDWIVASLHNMDENLVEAHSNLKFYRASTPLDWNTLGIIQRLSEAFFVLEDGLESESLVLYARDRKNVDLAHQYLVTLVQQSQWGSESVLYDVCPENLPKCQFALYGDSHSLPWNEQFSQWFRWEKVKTRTPIETAPYDLQPLNRVSFSESEQTASRTPEEKVSDALISQLDAVNSHGAVTVTATVGFVLHQPRQNTVLPNTAMPKTFATNIPLVSKVIGDLPLNDGDVKLEDMPDAQAHAAAVTESTSKEEDLWDLILGAKDNEDKTFTSKRRDLVNEVSRMVQIKLVADPFKEGDLHSQFPPIEVWAELGPRGINTETVRAVQVPREDDTLVSLPNNLADLKFSVTNTEEVEINLGLDKFLNACSVAGEEVRYAPSSVEVDINGQTVAYRLHSVNRRTQIELNYNGTMVQLSMIDGGKLAGRRIDATLVHHEEAGKSAVVAADLEKFVANSFRLIQDLDATSAQVDPSLVLNL